MSGFRFRVSGVEDGVSSDEVGRAVIRSQWFQSSGFGFRVSGFNRDAGFGIQNVSDHASRITYL
jgi:hypothetical protein